MKRFSPLITLMMLMCMACTQKLFTPQVFNIADTEEGTIHMRSTGFGHSLEQAYSDAMQRGFRMLLFQGVPESIQSTPLIPDEGAAKKSKPDIMNCFNHSDCYLQFTSQVNQLQGKEKVQGGFTTSVDYKINIRALRTYLEKNNVIRKFGY